ncbi:MAG: PPC domain-containing protein, partial [Planctomycetaceae bacterium]
GTSVDVRIGGHFLHGGCPFEIDGPGVTASPRITRTATTWFDGPMLFKPASQGKEDYPKDHSGQITIDSETRPGLRFWRVWTSQGVVPSKPFVVGDFPEVIESEADGRPIPQKVTLPVTANGRIFPREDVDLWTFDAKQGESITCEVVAARIGSPLDSHLVVRNSGGQQLAQNFDFSGTDSRVRFVAPRTDTYTVSIHDTSYRGLQHFVYRLTMTNGPFIDHIYPLGGQAGTTRPFRVIGQNAPNTLVQMAIPQDPVGLLNQFLPVAHNLTQPILMSSNTHPEFLEEDIKSDQPGIAVPTVLNGRIMKSAEHDEWTLVAKAGLELQIALQAAALGSPLDAVVAAHDMSGKQIAQGGSTLENPHDPTLSVKVPADGQFRLVVSHVDPEQTGPEYAYRITVRHVEPDFQIQLPSDAITLFREAESKFKITAKRQAGLDSEIALEIQGLPAGVTVKNTNIPKGKPSTELVFSCAKQVSVQLAKLTISGTAQIGDKELRRLGTVGTLRGAAPRTTVSLAVAIPTPFKLDGRAFRTSYGERGTLTRRHYRIERNGFKGPLTVSLADRQIRHQQGVVAKSLTVPAESTEFDYAIALPTWLEMNRTSRTVVMAVGEIKDWDDSRHMVSFSSGATKDQIIILTAPSPLSIRSLVSTLRVQTHAPATLTVEVARGVLKPKPVTIELLVPAHMQGIASKPVTIAADHTQAILHVSFAPKCGPFNMPLTIRATTLRGADPVIAETQVEFVQR